MTLVHAVALTALLLGPSGPLALAPTARPAAPIVRLGIEDEHHGSHLQGEKYQHEVEVFNDGDAPLEISKVTPSCGCTQVASYDAEIAPGSSGKIVLEIDTKKVKPGADARKNVRIFTNDPNTPKIVYWFTLMVIPAFQTLPQTIVISGIVDRPKEAEVDLLAANDLGFEIVDLKSREGKFEIVEWKLVEKDKRYRAKLRVGAAEAPSTDKGVLDMTIRVRDGRTVTIGTWVEIEHRPHILVQPDELFFANQDTNKLLEKDAKPITKTVMLAGTLPDTRFEVTRATVQGFPEGVLEIQVKPLIDGKRYRVDVILSEYQAKTYMSGKLHLETSDERSPTIEIPLRAMFGRRVGS